jgi:lipopolysaccharide export system permease protein
MRIFTKYITRQTLWTLVFTLGVFTFVLLLGRMLKQVADLLVNRQLDLWTIGKVVLLLVPYLLSFTLPMALLAAVLLVFGRLSADHELVAMRASGVSLGRIAAPVIVLAVLLMGLCFYINAVVAPSCAFRFRTLFLDLSTSQPMALLQEGTYIKDFPNYVVYVGRKHGNEIFDVALYALDEKGNVLSTIRARRGVVTGLPAARRLVLDLHEVRGDLRDPADPTNINKIRPGTTAQRYPIELDLGSIYQKAVASRKLTDLLYPELLEEIANLRARGIYPAAALMEAHQRVVMAVACVSFALLAIPLGITASRRETSIGIALALALALLFYFTTVLANMLRSQPHLYPELLLWTPNFIFQVVGLWLLYRASRA